MIQIIIIIKVNNIEKVLGFSLRNLKLYDEAILCYDKAIALDPNDSDYYNNKG